MLQLEEQNKDLMSDLTSALISAAKVVRDNFGKSVDELGTEYKVGDGDTARTVIDTYAQKRMQDYLFPLYPDAVFNLEESDVAQTNLEGKLLIFGDPFDGTANAQPRLPLSTQGLIAAQNGEYIAAAALHPFEKSVVYGAKGVGVFKIELYVDNKGEFYPLNHTERKLPLLKEVYDRIKLGKDTLLTCLDAIYNPINFSNQRKSKWKQLFVDKLDSANGGEYRNARMMREMGSNIHYSMLLAEGRLHVQLTDNIGGIYDVAAGAIFMPILGGVMTDMDGNPLKVPKTTYEMDNPPQQVVVASIHPELHERVLDITQQCYGADSKLFHAKTGEVFTAPRYTGFKKWDPKCKAIFDSLFKQ